MAGGQEATAGRPVAGTGRPPLTALLSASSAQVLIYPGPHACPPLLGLTAMAQEPCLGYFSGEAWEGLGAPV